MGLDGLEKEDDDEFFMGASLLFDVVGLFLDFSDWELRFCYLFGVLLLGVFFLDNSLWCVVGVENVGLEVDLLIL